MLWVNRVINRARASISNCQYLLSHDLKIFPSPSQHFASKSSIRFFDSYKGGADELNRGYFDDMSELKQHSGKIALANKILIPGIVARKFLAVDVIYSDGRKSKLLIIFYASGVGASKLAVPEASLVCLSFRANSQRHIVYSFGDPYYFRKELKILNLLTGYIFLLDKFGRIRWQGFGLAKQWELSSLFYCTKVLLDCLE
ncbi:hypothetical protein ES288_A06G047500v1 [Gossypium darwinii]|uniref:Uncharacterized protein n=1 Tax=Gossypium darwinii TaxID=34276 RepID=A0A5D2G3P8_GOSDA|nr:hypothetical protein ES288_A06G047500v1 [Gossypium darwinii]